MAVPVVSVGEGPVVLLALLGAKILVSRTSRRISTTVALVVTHVRSLIIFAARGYASNVILRAGMVSVQQVRFPFPLLYPVHSWVRTQTDFTRRFVW
jgi:hypothetical protein